MKPKIENRHGHSPIIASMVGYDNRWLLEGQRSVDKRRADDFVNARRFAFGQGEALVEEGSAAMCAMQSAHFVERPRLTSAHRVSRHPEEVAPQVLFADGLDRGRCGNAGR